MLNFNNWLLRESTDEQTWIKAIKSNPQDINTWLVFADWLEEHGDKRATLIRGVIQLRGSNKRKDNHNLLKSLDSIWATASQGEFARLLSQISIIVHYAMQWEKASLSNAAEVIRLARSGGSLRVSDTLERINKLIGGFGVEVVRSANNWDNYYGDSVCQYVNMGDGYDLTVLFDIPRRRYYIMDVFTWVEMNQRRYDIQ
jgi:uncharacterized protein (TIGR02996 family)